MLIFTTPVQTKNIPAMNHCIVSLRSCISDIHLNASRNIQFNIRKTLIHLLQTLILHVEDIWFHQDIMATIVPWTPMNICLDRYTFQHLDLSTLRLEVASINGDLLLSLLYICIKSGWIDKHPSVCIYSKIAQPYSLKTV